MRCLNNNAHTNKHTYQHLSLIVLGYGMLFIWSWLAMKQKRGVWCCICFSGKRCFGAADFNANSFPETRLSDAYCMVI